MPKFPEKTVPASLLRRAGAYLLDSLLFSALSWTLTFPALGLIYLVEKVRSPVELARLWDWISLQDLLLLEGLNFVAYLLVAGVVSAEWAFRWGSSPGKWVMRLWIVDARSSSPLTRPQAWGRTLAYFPSYLLVGVGFLMALFHPRRQALHDLLSRTLCVQRARSAPNPSN